MQRLALLVFLIFIYACNRSAEGIGADHPDLFVIYFFTLKEASSFENKINSKDISYDRISFLCTFLDHTPCNLQPATCNLQPATCNLQPATHKLNYHYTRINIGTNSQQNKVISITATIFITNPVRIICFI